MDTMRLIKQLDSLQESYLYDGEVGKNHWIKFSFWQMQSKLKRSGSINNDLNNIVCLY